MMEIKDYRQTKMFRLKIRLLPNWKDVLNYANKRLLKKHYASLQDCLIEGFKWDETPEGHEYWQNIHDSIIWMPTKKCCDKWMRVNDAGQYYKCQVCNRKES